MLSELFFIINILSSVIALSSEFINPEKKFWIHNKNTNLCLYASGIDGDRITCEVCSDSDNYKWYLISNNDGSIQITSALDTSTCIFFNNNNELVLTDCSDESALYYDETLKYFEFNDKCVGINDEDSSNIDPYLELMKCDKKNKNIVWDFVDIIPNEKVTTTETTTTYKSKPTPTTSPIWLYNVSTELCLNAPENKNSVPMYVMCESTDDYKWYYIKTKEGIYLKSKKNPDLCLRVDNEDESKASMGDCDDNAIFIYNNIYKSIESNKYRDKCIGNKNIADNEYILNKITLYDCSKEVRNDQKWIIKKSLPETSYESTKTNSVVWIYNESSNSCLYGPDYENGIPTYSECRNLDDYKWIITKKKEGYYFKSKSNSELCLKMADENKIIMGKCDNNALFNYNNNYKTIMSKYYNDRCVGYEKLHSYGVAFYSVTKRSVTLYDCSEEVNDDQMWQFRTSFPRKIVSTTRTTTTITTTTTTNTTSKSNPTSNNNSRCGKDFNNKSCSKGECCSKDGYCGTGSNYCGTGCQASYGRCNDGGRCGADYGKCLNDKQCCSQYGYCDISDAHCGSKCQSEFGLCYGSHDKCGEQYGRCKGDKCCSKWGYCGTTSKHCKNGCQPRYGLCK